MTTISLETWLQPPHNRLSLHQVDRLVPHTAIASGQARRGLIRPHTQPNWSDHLVPLGCGREAPLREFLELTNTDAICVLHGDNVLYEDYFNGNKPESRHIAMSVSKSFCGMLAGVLVAEGRLDLSAETTAYLPELAGSSYGGSTVSQLLDMTATPDFDMTYTNPDSEVQAGDRSAGWRPRRDDDHEGTRAFLKSLRGSSDHGSVFQYCSATTDVLAWVLERAGAAPYARLLEDRIWKQIGAEDDALITVDEFGTPYACAGMSMRLDDLARFGRLILDGGRRNGRQIIPEEWIRSTALGGTFDTTEDDELIPGSYKNQWWVPGDSNGSFYAVGIFGQYLWLDPSTDITIAKFSSEPTPLAHGIEHLNALHSIASRAAAWTGPSHQAEGRHR
ncbi:serine hydrolase [Saxibacter everestensis]|uniref:Serine hydrolase n=1 Tax=Saxibacter everestensis TaxID=2909229 RepID=A0ABY8QX18_9MICO|nr:serine hydrolase [Brevibacteriaceae bacterium ZFBP1038]